ncbi:MAG: NUDIX hydrolase [Lutibacter sp.]|nr:MAG: NUDIX hydrolase [Lutibacter sp.]
MQMYKVFVNDCPIILTENKNILTSFDKIDFNTCIITEIVERIFKLKLDGICLLCSDLEECWDIFQSKFKIQKAAGGKVNNLINEVLFIYRFNKWDLPKGKLEKGESVEQCAIREVEEECGIGNLVINKSLETTYHIFKKKGEIILKVTYWYSMTTDYCDNLTPQLEEGIIAAVFKNAIETKEALKNSYENIKLLF